MLLPLIHCGSLARSVHSTDLYLLHGGWRLARILYSFVFRTSILFPLSLKEHIAKPVQFYPSESTSKIYDVQFCAFLPCLMWAARRKKATWTWFMQDLEDKGPVISLWGVVILVLDFDMWEECENKDIGANFPSFIDFMLSVKNRQNSFAFCHIKLMSVSSFLEVIQPKKIV